MKKIKLEDKEFEVGTGNTKNKVKFSYKEHLLKTLDRIPPPSARDVGGLSIEEIEKRIRLKKLVTEAKKELILEQADYAYILNLVIKERWNVVHEGIVGYVNAIKNAEDYEVKKK